MFIFWYLFWFISNDYLTNNVFIDLVISLLILPLFPIHFETALKVNICDYFYVLYVPGIEIGPK